MEKTKSETPVKLQRKKKGKTRRGEVSTQMISQKKGIIREWRNLPRGVLIEGRKGRGKVFRKAKKKNQSHLGESRWNYGRMNENKSRTKKRRRGNWFNTIT